MILLFDFSLPLNNPVLIFSLVLFIFLLVPLVLNKFKIPSIIGLILAGVIIGPHGVNLLERNSSIILFGTVGLLYIMFLAALELDLNEFKKNRNKSLVFGALTFLVPFSIGSAVCYYFLEFELSSSLLISSMFSSHTLVAYPIASRLGITKNEAVTIAVGGTIITDTAVLLVLAIITGSTEGNLDAMFWIKLIVSLTIFSLIIFYGYPRIGAWFFKNVKGENTSHYIFVLAMIFTAAFLAELAGVEPIIGAFIAGLSLNRLIPHTSALMNRIEFVGNALFIPFFLISVGMLVDLKVLFQGTEALIVAGTLICVAFLGKFLAAYTTTKIFKYSSIQGNLLFGLSSAHAAATLAVILIGFQLGLVNENVLNGTILLILITCLVSSFVTENYGRKLAVIESDKKPELKEAPERILVPIANPANIENLIDLAIMIKDPQSRLPIYPLAVVKDDDEAKEKILMSNKWMENAIKHASASDNSVQIVTRVDWNVTNGILRAIKELLITEVVLGWNGKISTHDKIFGSILDVLLEKSEQMFLVTKIISPLNTLSRICLVLPPHVEYESGFKLWMTKMKTLSKQIGADLVFYCSNSSIEKVKQSHDTLKPTTKANFEIFEEWGKFPSFAKSLKKNDLLIVISARKGTISYNHYQDRIPAYLARFFEDASFIILYPEQNILIES
ncbi:MAG TPA: cation:proton antiporter [Cytophagales bacterium]|nr:cation:proton antiporter [Cytophagales bacterium]